MYKHSVAGAQLASRLVYVVFGLLLILIKVRGKVEKRGGAVKEGMKIFAVLAYAYSRYEVQQLGQKAPKTSSAPMGVRIASLLLGKQPDYQITNS